VSHPFLEKLKTIDCARSGLIHSISSASRPQRFECCPLRATTVGPTIESPFVAKGFEFSFDGQSRKYWPCKQTGEQPVMDSNYVDI